MTGRRALAPLWAANLATIVVLSFVGRRLQRLCAAAVSGEARETLTIALLCASLAVVVGALARSHGRAAALRAGLLAPLLALGLWLVPLPEEQVHFLVFGLFGALTFALFEPWRALAIAVGVAVADELLQGALPDRYFDVRDIVMNSASAFAGAWVQRGIA